MTISAEVRRFITDKVSDNVIVTVEWLANEILKSHADIYGDDADFYRECAYSQLKEIVRGCIGKYDTKKPADVTDAQIVLPGFEHLQVAYTMERKKGEVQLVPINLCTDAELNERAQFFDKQAKGCRVHANELRKFVSARPAEQAA